MATFWGYDILKKMVSEVDDDINSLKNLLSPDIGSVRQLDQIDSILDLIDCLERKDIINEEDVNSMKQMTKNQQVLRALDAYQSAGIKVPVDVNLYQEERLAEQIQQDLQIRTTTQQALSNVASAPPQQNYVTPAAFTAAKREAVFRKISEQLGRSWRDLGRNLSIGEGAMDAIHDRYPRDLKSRILHLLKVAEEDESHDPKQFLKRLCRGLAEAGRNDLRNRVEETMSH